MGKIWYGLVRQEIPKILFKHFILTFSNIRNHVSTNLLGGYLCYAVLHTTKSIGKQHFDFFFPPPNSCQKTDWTFHMNHVLGDFFNIIRFYYIGSQKNISECDLLLLKA